MSEGDHGDGLRRWLPPDQAWRDQATHLWWRISLKAIFAGAVILLIVYVLVHAVRAADGVVANTALAFSLFATIACAPPPGDE